LTRRPLISLIIPIHNEEEYLPESLKSLKEIEDQFFELLFILDRCTANSESIVMQWFPDARIVKEESSKWENSLAENSQLGFEASKGIIICTQDADATAPHDLGPSLGKLQGDVASVAPTLLTRKDVPFLNRLYYWWEKTRRFAPLGEEPRGAFRLIRRECLEQVGSLKDVIAQETQLDVELRNAGYRSTVVKDIVCYRLRWRRLPRNPLFFCFQADTTSIPEALFMSRRS